MLTLYYSPGACSMASHIALEETGAEYTPQPVLIPKGEHQSADYLKNVNPRGKVPALRTDQGVITENVAILGYLARSFPEARLLPVDDTIGLMRCVSHMAYLSNTLHPTFARIVRPERIAKDEAAQNAVKETARESFLGLLKEVDGIIDGNQWVMGSQYTACDPYTLVFYGWGSRIGLPVKELNNYTRFKDRMIERPAVRKVLEREQSPLQQG
ncbi:MAG: glutathione S-transferase N-terminal domain-containing protein [Alphaproteobacteria bacterium]|nr:glutathione S-transferase N-terminal domain-containing protein [Alphaproteobacteria bacterium]